MKKYVVYITQEDGNNNAGPKAGSDTVSIAVRMGYEFVELYKSKGTHTTICGAVAGFFNIKNFVGK